MPQQRRAVHLVTQPLAHTALAHTAAYAASRSASTCRGCPVSRRWVPSWLTWAWSKTCTAGI